jgi:hypothetical protein
LSPEERQKWADGASTVLSVAAAAGGTKTRATAAVVSASAAAHRSRCSGQAPVSEPAPGPSAPVGTPAPLDAPPETVLVTVEAVADAGQPMVVEYEGAEYQVSVPAGVARGQPFVSELPRRTAPAVAVGIPLNEPPAQQPPAPPPAQQPQQPPQPQATLFGPSPPGAWSSLSSAVNTASQMAAAANEANQAAKALGITPQRAAQAAKELGITPEAALRAGVAGAKALNAGATQAARYQGPR